MIKVLVGTTTNRQTLIVAPTRAIRSILEEGGYDYSMGTTLLDGISLKAGDMDKTLADFGITEQCRIVTAENKDNA